MKLNILYFCALFSIFESSRAAFAKFDMVEVDAASWQTLQVRSNVLSIIYCSIQCISSNVFSAFIYNPDDKSCKLGIYGNTRPPNGGPTIKISAKQGTYRILVGGGGTAHSYVSRFEVIDMDSPLTRCQNPPSASNPFSGAAGGVNYQNQPFFCGGSIGYRIHDKNCYYLKNNVWNVGTPMLYPRAYFALDKNPFSETLLYFFAGSYYSNGNTAEIFNKSGFFPMSTSSAPNMEFSCAMFIDETTILIASSAVYNTPSQTTYLFNLNTQAYSPGPPLLYARTNFGCGRINKDGRSKEKILIVAGGAGLNGKEGSEIQVYDKSQGQWAARNPLPIGNAGLAMADDPNGGVVVVVGSIAPGVLGGSIFRLSNAAIGTQWEIMAQTLKVPTWQHFAMVLPNFTTNCTWP